MAGLGKPMLVSTGGRSLDDVRRAADEILPINSRLAIVRCTATHPAAFEELNLRVITTLREAFPDGVIGFSAHDNGIAMALAAYMLGARIIEKHFMPGDGRRGQAALRERDADDPEDGGEKLVAARFIAASPRATAEDVVINSPGDGWGPWELPEVIGRVALRSLERDDAMRLDHLGDCGRRG